MDVFLAVADPIRRRIVELLVAGPLEAGKIGSAFEVSQPAMSRHLRVLREAGLVSVEPNGTRRVYSLHPAGLGELGRWVDRYRRFWDERLDELGRLAEEGS